MKSRLYLKIGDRVEHLSFSHWGKGEVVVEQHSMLAGGFCLVRILFDDGVERSFINDLITPASKYLNPSFHGLTGESIRNWMLRSSRSMTCFIYIVAEVIITSPAVIMQA